MAVHFQELNLRGIRSNIIHVTEGTQCPAKQALIMTEEAVGGIQVFKLLAFSSSNRFLVYWLLVSSKACQSNGKTRAMQRVIAATGKQTEIT